MASSIQSKGALFAVLFVVLQASLVRSAKTFQCKDHDITLSDEKIEALKQCGEQVGVKSMEEMTPDKIPCLSKCIMEKGGLVDADGKAHKENILKDIDGAVPDNAKNAYKAAAEKCIDEFGNNLTSSDPKCLSYGPLAMCVITAFKVICKV